MKTYKLEYTNNITRNIRTRNIKANNIEDAKLWFENNLDNDNLLDYIEELD